MFLFIGGLIIGGILGVIFGYAIFLRKNHLPKTAKQVKKQQNQTKILDLLDEKLRITNNDVEKLLGVSDATATRYLEGLEQDGRIVQKGKTGKYVYYER